jgi:uncharacterized protein YbjT (DUF2867 family)
VSPRLAAVTGATGFLGQHLVRTLADAGWRVRVLARRDPVSPFWGGLEPQVVHGDLSDQAALARLCQGADAIFHTAGLIGGPHERLRAVNVDGARRLAEAAARAAPGAHVLLISSLAAREPQLSAYAATKRAGEDAMREVLGSSLTVARPPVIYGPGDRETLQIFRAAATSPVLPLLHPAARVAMIHAEDAARQIVALESGASGRIITLSDARPEGYGWRELMQAAAAASDRSPSFVRIPTAALYALASVQGIGDGWRHGKVTITFGKVRELTHLDWGVRPDERTPGAPDPVYDLLAGFKQTVRWYRKRGWL